MVDTHDATFHLDLPVDQEWQNIDLLQTSMFNCLTVVFHDNDFCNSVSMVGGELLENALKYGDWTGPRRFFRLRVSGDGSQVIVEVSNPVAKDGVHVGEVLRTVHWLKQMPSHQEAYAARLHEIAGNAVTGGSLGLVRVAYEGACQLDAALNAENILVVRATCTP